MFCSVRVFKQREGQQQADVSICSGVGHESIEKAREATEHYWNRASSAERQRTIAFLILDTEAATVVFAGRPPAPEPTPALDWKAV